MRRQAHGDEILARLSAPTETLLTPIQSSWRRCVETYGLDPHRLPRPTILSRKEVDDVRRPIDDLVAMARDEVDRLFLRLRDHDYMVTLADGSGLTLLLRCAETQLPVCRDAGVLIGSIWAEESQGTNGIGTCIKEARPVSIVMSEHFSAELVDLSCTVAPIMGASGKIVSVLNVTTHRETDHRMQAVVRDIVCRSARRIENLYFASRNAASTMLRISRQSDFGDIAWEERIAIDDAGRIVDATQGARRMLFPESGGPVGRTLKELGPLPAMATAPGQERMGRLLSPDGSSFYLLEQQPARARRGGSRGAEPAPRKGGGREARPEIETLLGHDALMSERVRIARKLIDRRLPVLLQGETGTGKSSLTKLLHSLSRHNDGAFVSLNCAAIPPDLIESELFGYRPGAFTGAARQGAKGRLLEADGGTLFLDEIGDMPLTLQTRLLHVLSDGEFVPVGGVRPVKVEVAVISASLHDIAAMVRAGRFREDLYYRLNGATLRLPALRDRADRHALIQSVFADEGRQVGLDDLAIDDAVVRVLDAYGWPGNLRELRHVARYAATLADNSRISLDVLPPPFDTSPDMPGDVRAEVVDRRLIEATLDQARWNVSVAATRMGMSRTTLHRKMRALGIRRRSEH